ncbi:MAG: EAL domain-containing protein [Candidatus Magnetoovum sp. WYHC-5]|nr:EAL domain-containing protein [Candidatus Magnetoovum sp. WYHC-5]
MIKAFIIGKKISRKLFICFLSFSLFAWGIGYFAITICGKALEESIIAHHLDLDRKYIELIEHHMMDRVAGFMDFTEDPDIQQIIDESNVTFDNLNDVSSYIENIDKQWQQAPENVITPIMDELINNHLSSILKWQQRQAKIRYGYDIYSEVLVTNKYGAIVAQTSKTNDYKQSDEQWWQIAKKQGIYIGKAGFDDCYRVYSIVVGIAIKDNKNNFIGVIKVIIGLDTIQSMLHEMKGDISHKEYTKWRFGILENDGKVIYASDKLNVLPNKLKQAFLNNAISFINDDKKWGKVLATYVTHKEKYRTVIKPFGWLLISEHSTDEIYVQVNRLEEGILLVLVILTILSFILSYYLSNIISKPLSLLTEAVNKFSDNNLDVDIPAIGSEDEIGQLSKAFRGMSEKLKSSFNRLSEVNKKLENNTEEIKKSYDLQNIISSILKLSFKEIDIKEFLDIALDNIFSLVWFTAGSVGCIFLYDEKTGTLRMTARKNFPKELLEPCKEVQVGKCLCGLAASRKELIYKDCIDKDHEITYENIPEHGHYCVPIMSKEKVLGVINVVGAIHKKDEMDKRLLLMVADTIATVIERKRSDEKVEYMANYDELTGIPNRALLFDRLNQSIQHSKRFNDKTAVLYFDLDHFKGINDTYGHDAGDVVLKKVSKRLLRCIRDIDTVSRLGGDEFVVVTRGFKTTDELNELCVRIIKEIARPIEYKGKAFSINTSIGISVYPNDGDNGQLLLKKADTAMYNAKASDGSVFLFYNDSMDKHIKERDKLEEDIRYALESNQFVLHYQPQIDLKTNKVIGAEALIRWQHPIFGMIYPDKFISIAEETGIIVEIGNWVIKTACTQSMLWKKEGVALLTMAVNVASNQFQRYDFVDNVSQILLETKTDPRLLELEITERISIKDIETTIDVLHRFNSIGIKVSIDDFGTGYSSLSYLKRLPFNKIKIDRSFIMDIQHSQDALTIVKTIIDMSHNLKMPVIAEGIETTEQLELLKALNCDEAQGYLFSKPVTSDDFIKFVKDRI